MLELCWVTTVHWHRRTVHVQLTDYTRTTCCAFLAHEFRSKRSIVRAFAQTQEADQDVPLGVLVGQERFPSTVCSVISPNQFYGLRPYFMVDFVNLPKL